MKKIYLALLAGLFLLFAVSAHAEAPAWTIDKVHSGIYFDIQHIYSTVKGQFNEFDGKIHFDPDNLDQSRFDFTVNVNSIDTKTPKRDSHLLSGDFFDAKTYPVMTFKSASIKHLGEERYTVEGTLTVKDVSRTVTIPFDFFGTKPNPFNPKQRVAGFEARMTLDRLEYHVGNGKFLKLGVVGKDAVVLISIETTRDQ